MTINKHEFQSFDDHLARPHEPIPILMYHNVASAPAEAAHRGLYLEPKKFRYHLGVLQSQGYRGVSMEEGLPYLQGARQGRVAIITFDDGYVDNLEQAMPALQAHGFSATCYLVAAQLGGFNVWDRGNVHVRKPLMNAAQIREWLDGGMHVGSHTLNHPHLSVLPRASKECEIKTSRVLLEDRLGVPIEHFCFPYGDYDSDCLRMVADAGYRTAVTTTHGRVGEGQSLFALNRVPNSGKRSRAFFHARAWAWKLMPRLATI